MLVLGVGIGFFFGAAAGLAVVLVLQLVLWVYALYNVSRLVHWAQAAPGAHLPAAHAVWDYLCAHLARRERAAREREAALAASLARFREATRALPDGIIYLSRHGLIEWLNPAAAEYFGLDPERDPGRAITTLIRDPAFVHYLRLAPAELGSEPLILHSPHHGGLSLSVLRVPFGHDLEMVLARDITQLERLDTMRRDFVANVSHELKTPLTVVTGFVETVLDAEDDIEREDRQRYLSMALEQSQRMQRLIEDLLTLSALQAGAEPASEELVDVQALMGSVYHEAEVLSSGRHVLSLDPGPAAQLRGSQKELHSAFSNLVSNAVRYTPEGGRVSMSWRMLDDGGGAFTVEDTGIGIGAEHIGRLTERFYRVDRGRSREMGGTGLGLAIVKHVMTHHQGRLDIESQPGRGSRFTARFAAKRVDLRA